MLSYLVRRVALSVVVLFGLLVATFVIIHLVPGDPVQQLLGGRASPQAVAAVREDIAARLLRGAATRLHQRPVADEVADDERPVGGAQLRVEVGGVDHRHLGRAGQRREDVSHAPASRSCGRSARADCPAMPRP